MDHQVRPEYITYIYIWKYMNILVAHVFKNNWQIYLNCDFLLQFLGTGKTLLAGALAHECCKLKNGNVSFFHRKAADILVKWVGESEQKLRDLFTKVLFITEIILSQTETSLWYINTKICFLHFCKNSILFYFFSFSI